jgi:hypothetical protein
VYTSLSLPDGKGDLEHTICMGALRSQAAMGIDLWHCKGSPVQLPEDDYDFALRTPAGREYLDLVEFAPLASLQGKYERVPAETTNGDVADAVWALIARKSEHYAGLRGVKAHLLVFSADFRLRMSPNVIGLVALRATRVSHGFRSIAHYTPLGAETGWFQAIAGDRVSVRAVSAEEEQSIRMATNIIFDLRNPERTEDGSGLSFR